jgi:hypothetical protein
VAVVPVLVETAPKKSFAVALGWPGWARAGRDPAAALDAYADRYRPVVERAGLRLPARVRLDVVDTVTGNGGTSFGVPSIVVDADADPVPRREADRLARVLEASWAVFEEVAAEAPPVLRKGPRGGGRDTAAIVDHVRDAEGDGYLRMLGLRRRDLPTPAQWRPAVLEVLRSGRSGGRWPVRYAARRLAWHALDHAWEIEDRSEA